jgi:prepilin-type N-terminal cleavage/methylation domain-containing protein
MKIHTSQNCAAMTLFEVLVVIVILAVLVAILLPAIIPASGRRQGISCVNNLKEISLGYRIWAGDNGSLYPTDISVTNGGAMEWAATGDVAAVFQVMSNELGTPKILVCPDDATHAPATNFATGFSAKNISYFAGLDATNDSNPQMLLVGDSNFSVDGVPAKSGLLKVSTNSIGAWLPGRHPFYQPHFWESAPKHISGNVAMNDGSVQQFSSKEFQNVLAHTGLATNRFALP